jgi:PIN like domain
MSTALEDVAFVIDENLIGLGRGLMHLRRDIAMVGQGGVAELLPKGILDSEWIPIVGDRGWVMITNDQRIRTRPSEAPLAIAHRLKVIHLKGNVGMQTAWAQAIRLFSRWEGIDNHLSNNPDGPWWLSVRGDRVQAMRFDPGAVERV